MDISIIGSGNIARQLIPAFQKHGFKISGLYGRNKEAAALLSDQFQVPLIQDITKVDSAIVLLCVSDDAIPQVAEQIKNYNGIVIHTSGSVPSTLLSAFPRYGVFYPVQTMTKQGKVNFEKVPVCITASDAATLDILHSIAGVLSNQVYTMDDDHRLRVHLAAVMTNNFINHLVVMARDFLQKNNLDYEVILPLLRTTFEKLTQAPYNFQQTGPAVRNDTGVIARHMELLTEDPELLTLYQSITESIKSHAHH